MTFAQIDGFSKLPCSEEPTLIRSQDDDEFQPYIITRSTDSLAMLSEEDLPLDRITTSTDALSEGTTQSSPASEKVPLTLQVPDNSTAALSDVEPLRNMLWKLASLAGPTFLSTVFIFLNGTMAQSFVGRRLGSDALASLSVGMMVFNLCGLSLAFGLTAAVDTLAAQAYGRDPNSREIGELLQRSLLINYILCIPIGIFFLLSEPLLQVVFGEVMGADGSLFVKNSIPYLFLAVTNTTIVKILQAQNLAYLPILANLIGAVTCWFLNFYFPLRSIVEEVYLLTYANLATLIALVLIALLYPGVVLRRASWFPPSFSRIVRVSLVKEYFTIGIPALIATIAEWWAFELLLVICAQTTTDDVATLSLVFAVNSVVFSAALSMSVGMSVSIGNALGENRPNVAKRYGMVGMLVNVSISCCTVSTVFLLRHRLPLVFSTNPRVINKFNGIIAFVLCMNAGDSTQFALNAIFRGSGEQKLAARACVLSLWCVGIPAACFFALYEHFGVGGVVGGLLCGFCVEIPALLWYLRRIDWPKIALEAARSREEEVAIAPQEESEMSPTSLPVIVIEGQENS